MHYKYLLLVILLGFLISGCIQPQEKNQSNPTKVNTGVTGHQNDQTIIEPGLVKNESKIDNKSFTISKTAYNKGENVEALFNFEGELFIQPYVRISRFENGTWNVLGMWDFNGVQYTCCGTVPACSKYNSSMSSPLRINWDQKIVEEPLPVPPGKNMTKKQVDSGKYQIRVVYGDQSACMDGIDAGFLIK